MWVDVENPTKEELAKIAEDYALNAELIIDCLDPEHLPKIEEGDGTSFIIARLYDIDAPDSANTVVHLTRKLVIVTNENYILTIHRSPMGFIREVCAKLPLREGKKALNRNHVLALLMNRVFSTYTMLINDIDNTLSDYEEQLFSKTPQPEMMQQFYQMKRKASLSRKLILLSKDIVNKIELNAKGPIIQDLKDTYTAIDTALESNIENAGYLISTYLSLTSQHTNEIMRVLTILSVFFMPLTFIVGVYGMNFEKMPEIAWDYGYFIVWIIMILITALIFIIFRKKKWM